MRILKIIHGYPPHYNAGSEVYSQSICSELARSHEVIVFTREENEYLPDYRLRTEYKNNIRFVYANMARGKDGYNHPLLNGNFRKLVTQLKPDIAHIGHLNHLSTGIIDELYDLNIPMLYTLHDFWLMCPRGQFLQRNSDGKNLYQLCNNQEDRKCATSCYSMYHSGVEGEEDETYWTHWISTRMITIRMACNKIERFHAPSRYLMQRFIEDFGIPETRIFHLDYGFPLHYLKPVRRKLSGTFTFGYIGTHIPQKGINLLIEAFGRLKGKAALKIFGRNNGQSTAVLQTLADKCSCPVEFCGEYVNQNLAESVFNHVDCIVVPSIWAENSPLVIHEAQACRIPVVTANYGGMKEYVRHQENGLLFQHRNAESLREQMQYALDNPALMVSMGQRGYLYSQNGEVPSIEQHCEALVNVYNQLIHQKTGSYAVAHHH